VSFPTPVAVVGITVITAALLHVLCRCLRARARHRDGPASQPGLRR
jgi:hypothetical protein